MHIVYLHQYFATPKGKTGTRSYEFAKRWVRAGIDVTVITSPAQLSEEELAETVRVNKTIRRLTIDGIEVLIVEAAYHQTMSYSARIKSFLKFSISATRTLLKMKDVDLIYATSTPLTIALPAIAKYKLNKVPFIFEVRDLWPLVPIALGIIKNPIMKKMLFGFERYVYKNAKGIVALSPDMKRYIDKITNLSNKTIVSPNCADVDLFVPLSDDERNEVRKRLGWENKFVVVHSGAIGKVNGLYRVIEQAEILQAEFGDKIIFVLIGEGKEKQRLVELVKCKGVNNVIFMNPVAKRELAKLLGGADVGLVSIDKVTELQYNSANKFFDYLAAGLPVVLNYGGWQKEILHRHNAGFGVDNFDEEKFIENVITLYNDGQLRKMMGCNARKLAEREYNRDVIAEQVKAFIVS